MASIGARIIRRGLRRIIKPTEVDERFVTRLRRRTSRQPVPTFPRRGIERQVIAPGELGRAGGEMLRTTGATRHLLYLHGGYYLAGSPKMYRSLTGRLARGLDANVVVPEYRLAPEHPYPAAVDDAVGAYRALLEAGVDPAAIAVAGDSAGGGLALAMLVRARTTGLAMPAAAVLLSPWTDLSGSAPSVDRNDTADDMLSAAALRYAAACYAGSHDRSDPELSPIRADLTGLPPLFVTVDDSEILLDDALGLAERVRDLGGRVTLRRSTGLFHVWPIVVPVLREARETVADIVAFLDAELA